MLIAPNQHFQVLESLVNDNVHKTVAIFVALDVDAICCCYLLTFLLREKHIRFTVIPVSGFQHLKREFANLIGENNKMQVAVFLNNGGTIDLEVFLFEENQIGDMLLYVLDSHRPFNLSNVTDVNQSVLLLSDQRGIEADYPLQILQSNENDEKEIAELERLEKVYYRGTWFGTASSLLMYRVASKFSRSDNNLLWKAIIGVTSQLESEQIGPEDYLAAIRELQKETLLLNLSVDGIPSANSLRVGQIAFSYEPKLALHRHWNIYDALSFSRNVAAQFMIWKENGRKRLLDFIVKLSLPIKECKREFSSLRMDDQKTFWSKLKKMSERFELHNFYFGSFVKKCDAKTLISASEHSSSISALFSRNYRDEKILIGSFWEAYDSIALKELKLFRRGITLSKEFWRAVIQQGVLVLEKRLYKTNGPFCSVVLDEVMDQLVVANTSNLLRLALFLYDALEEIVLKKRGKRKRESIVSRTSRPLVICALDKRKEVYLIVGLSSKVQGEFKKNAFVNAFREAAERTASRYRQDDFCFNFIEVQKVDKEKFLEYLQSGLVDI